MTSSLPRQSITGAILAGGAAQRLGGQDKGLIKAAGKPLVEYVIQAIRPQVGHLVISANRHQAVYEKYGYPVIEDSLQGFQGPLAGIASCLQAIDTEYMLTVPCDSPYVPEDLTERLYRQLQAEQATLSTVHTDNRLQPVFCLMKTTLLDSLLAYLQHGERKTGRWFEQQHMAVTDFSDKPQAFLNINTAKDLKQFEANLPALTNHYG